MQSIGRGGTKDPGFCAITRWHRSCQFHSRRRDSVVASVRRKVGNVRSTRKPSHQPRVRLGSDRDSARPRGSRPLGTAAFALTTFVLSTFNAGLMPTTLEPVVLGLALFYGGIVQVFAGLLEFFKENTLGGVAFCSYGGFWLALWYLSSHTEFSATITPSDKGHAVGLFLLGWTIFTAYMTVCVARTNNALLITFVFLLAAFVCLTIGDFAGSTLATRLGGWTGFGAAAGAWYCSFAATMNATAGRAIVPVGPRSR
ncbi:acetate uptake transporter [Kineosphaera limosa]|uniref:acetate uptake transporter n=1 Tax=Kineosphaera limosa TaxID=111564 RepID=UPI0030B7F63B